MMLCMPVKKKSPFTTTALKDSAYTIESFLAALKYNPLAAKSYISKNYVDKIDLSMIPLPNGVSTPLLVRSDWKKTPHGCKGHTVLTFSEEGVSFLHFYTFREPDVVSNYKIYCVEKECISCV